jgi:hypothetical protein
MFYRILVFFLQSVKKCAKKLVKLLALSLSGNNSFFFIKTIHYMKEKYSTVTFAHMDKVGKLDEIKNPEIYFLMPR